MRQLNSDLGKGQATIALDDGRKLTFDNVDLGWDRDDIVSLCLEASDWPKVLRVVRHIKLEQLKKGDVFLSEDWGPMLVKSNLIRVVVEAIQLTGPELGTNRIFGGVLTNDLDRTWKVIDKADFEGVLGSSLNL